MRLGGIALALLAVGCVRSSSVTCDDGTVCREGTSCFAVDDHYVCVGDGEVVCGNGRVETGEACDDGNTRIGDGCSADCLSDETCGNDVVDPVVLVEGPNGPVLVGNEQCDDGNLVSHDGCSSSCVPETAQWVKRPSLPSERFDTAMTTEDSARRIVLFGGRDGDRNQHFNDTWEWSAGGWSQIRIALSPVPRSGHAMAYDGTRTVMFGGTTGNATLGDTWVLTSHTWAPATGSTNPEARKDHAMAFMPGVGIVMFGGETSSNDSSTTATLFGDTWIFDSAGWRKVAITGPRARSRHAMAYDPVRDRIVLVGGKAGAAVEASTWEFDGTQWTPRTNASTPAIYDAALAFDRVRGRLVLQGGAEQVVQQLAAADPNEQEARKTYEWTGTTWMMATDDTTPGARFGASASTDPITGRALVFGGAAGLGGGCGIIVCIVPVNTTHTWNGTTWTPSEYSALPGLQAHTGTFDPDRRRVVVFGGADGSPGANIYELVDSWKIIPPKGTAPSARIDAAIAHVAFPGKHSIMLFGGKAGAVWSNETWSFDGTMWTAVSTTTAPPGRSKHSIAYDANRGRLVMFGGQDQMGLRQDLWEFDGNDWTQVPFLPSDVIPEARESAAMAYDPGNKNIVLFGGDVGSAVDGRTWTWDGTSWVEHTSALNPPPRSGAGMAWDPVRERVVLFGGGETVGNDAWEWDGTAWSFVSIFDPPQARRNVVLASSPSGDGVLAIGGADDAMFSLSEVLQLTYLSTSSYETCRADLDDDGDGAAGCLDPDCWATCTPYCELRDESCLSLAPRCGDGVCDRAREDCGICSDCTCEPQCGDLVCDPGEDATSCPGDC